MLCNSRSTYHVHLRIMNHTLLFKRKYLMTLLKGIHYVRKSYRYFKKSCSNHVLISHFRPYWLVRHHLWTINPQCKFEEIFWNHQKYTIFDENSCLALPVTSYLVRFGKICLATASRHCSTHQLNTLYQWRDLFSPFLALKTKQK